MGARTSKGRGEAGKIIIMGRKQVMPIWADDPVRINNGCWCRGCWCRRGTPPQKDIGRWEERVRRVKNKYVKISNGA